MTVRGIHKLWTYVTTAQRMGIALEWQRVGSRDFQVQCESTDVELTLMEAVRDVRRGRAWQKERLVFDRGFVFEDAVTDASSIPARTKQKLVLVAGSSVALATAVMFSGGSLAKPPHPAAAQKPKFQVQTGHKTSTATTSAACQNRALTRANGWQALPSALPSGWSNTEDLTLGGVRQISFAVDCGNGSKTYLMVDLVKLGDTWKVKDAAPTGPRL